MNKINFDQIIDRKGTDCLKYDFAVRRGRPADVLPLWVADMDFAVPKEVTEALAKRVQHGIFGYSESGDSYFEAVAGWMWTHHGYEVQPEWLVKTPGVVFALAMAVRALTKEEDAVLIQQPVYYPFSEVIRDNGRKLVDSPLVLDEHGHYQMDFADLEEKIIENDVRLLLLCSPHNPVGRVWTEEELRTLADICIRHEVWMVSDEIHADFVFEGKHHMLASLGPEIESRTITCTSASKTFNLAGLQTANIFIPNPRVRRRFQKEVAAAGYSQLNALGLVATEAAYRYGDDWYRQLLGYLRENLAFLEAFTEEHLPGLRVIRPEGTYLVWMDFRGLGLTEPELEHFIVHEAKLWLDAGAVFGAAGEGFERINIACPRSTLNQALCQLEEARSGLCSGR